MKFSPQVIVVLIAMLGYLLYYYISGEPGNLVSIKSKQDGREYRVQDLPDKQEAAELMSTIRRNIEKVVNFYKQEEHASDPPAKLLVERFHPENMMENSMTSRDTSYSENKGEKIVICLRDKDTPPLYPLIDINTIMFVVLHEMSHLMTADLNSHAHTPEFWANFRRLLEDSAKLGIYNPTNYSHTPVPYCGMMITDSPL